MPKSDGAASSDVKPEPYPKQSPKKERSQKTAWTDEMDKIMINHILSNANITFNYDWPALQKLLPGLTVTQLDNHWNAKVKKTLFPNEVLKKTKQAKADVKGERSLSQE